MFKDSKIAKSFFQGSTKIWTCTICQKLTPRKSLSFDESYNRIIRQIDMLVKFWIVIKTVYKLQSWSYFETSDALPNFLFTTSETKRDY